MNRTDRAKQFMPFSPLKGYYEKLLEKQKVKEAKKQLSESEIERLSTLLLEVKRGQMLSVTYYNQDHYEKIQGLVSEISKDFSYLVVVKVKIPFEDIFQINLDTRSTL